MLTLSSEISKLPKHSGIEVLILKDTISFLKSENPSEKQSIILQKLVKCLPFLFNAMRCSNSASLVFKRFVFVWEEFIYSRNFSPIIYSYQHMASCNSFEVLIKVYSSLHDIEKLSFLYTLSPWISFWTQCKNKPQTDTSTEPYQTCQTIL